MDKKTFGFTLVELLVVILIIGILATLALPLYQKAVDKSRVAEAVTLLDSLGKAEELTYLSHGYYTQNMDELDLSFPKKAGDTDTRRDTAYFRFSTADTPANFPTNFIATASPQWKYLGAYLQLTLTPQTNVQRSCVDPNATGFCQLVELLGYPAATPASGDSDDDNLPSMHQGGSND